MIILTNKQTREALSQINWARSKAGTFRHDDPLLITQQNLRECNAINETDAALLRQSIQASITHIRRYNYGPNLDGNKLRQEALNPLQDLLATLKGS